MRTRQLVEKISDFCWQPHFPFFLLLQIRRMSPTVARYLQYGRYNPNTEAYWDRRYQSGSYQREEDRRYQALDREILKMIAPGSQILDVGCGTGRMMQKLREQRNCYCAGIDISGVAVRQVRAKGFSGFRCELPEIASDLTPNTFDVCTIMETLEHLTSPRTTLQRLSIFLKDDGVFIVSVPENCMKPNEFDEHVSSFDRKALCDLLAQFCAIDRVLSIDAGGNNHLIVRGTKTRNADIPFSSFSGGDL